MLDLVEVVLVENRACTGAEGAIFRKGRKSGVEWFEADVVRELDAIFLEGE